MGHFFKAAAHQIQQLRTEPLSFLHFYQVAKHLTSIEALIRLAEHHRVDVHSQKVYICLLLPLEQLLTTECSQLVLTL